MSNKNNPVLVDIYDNQNDTIKINNENNELTNNEEHVKFEWKEHHEKILVDWADKATCYRWLHTKSCNKYTFLRNIYTIPVIILSTLTGTANFAIERIPENYRGYCQIAIGSLNILAGIITTISQFLKINELSVAHRVCSISWDKFYRNIRVELVKCPEDRTNVKYLIKSCKDEYDRLMETSPDIDISIINKFNKTFNMNSKMNKKTINDTIKSIHKPEILDSFESTINIVYKPTKQEKSMSIIKDKINEKDKNNEKVCIIENFILKFQKEYSRYPSMDELYDNLESKVSNQVVEKFVSGDKWLGRK